MACLEILGRKAAAARLGRKPRWMDRAPIPRRDLRLPGAKRPEWGWCSDDLEAFLDARTVLPGHASHIE